MRPSLSIIVPTVTFAVGAAGHGYVAEVTIDSTGYKGNVPNTDKPIASVVRLIDTISPVKGSDNPFLNCGQDAQFGEDVAQANPGDKMTFEWLDGDGTEWPHNTGPMLTYMTSCGNTPCSQFNSSSAKWFKIDQVAKDPTDSSNATWLQQRIMNGYVANVTVPNNIAPGNYLIRHEIIALHLATSLGGAEFYPSCTQLTIGGDGTDTPSNDELVTLPGAYNDNDPGIYDPDVYDPGSLYIFPGPPVAELAQATAATPYGTTSDSSSASTTTASGSAPSSSSPPVASSKNSQCQLKLPLIDTAVLAQRRKRMLHTSFFAHLRQTLSL